MVLLAATLTDSICKRRSFSDVESRCFPQAASYERWPLFCSFVLFVRMNVEVRMAVRIKFGVQEIGAFGKPCFCPAKKEGVFDENGENDELHSNQ